MTLQLAGVVKDAVPAAARRRGHPARKTFQALRIEVNHELDVLERGLHAAIRWANTGGRICVISYHSHEDRIVKRILVEMSRGCVCPPGLPVCVCGHVPILFDPTRGLEFTTFATPTILGEIRRHFRDKGWSVRVPRRLQELSSKVNQTKEELTKGLQREPSVEEVATALNTTVDASMTWTL